MRDLIFILKHGTAILELTHAPDGWNDTLVTYERSSTYFGLFRSYSVSLKFVKEGAAFFRNAVYNHGLSAVVEVEIKRLDRATMTYYTAYIAEADLSSFKDDGIMVTVNLADGGLSALIKKNEKTEYVIEIPEPGIWIKDAIALNYVNLEDLFIKIMDKVTGGKISDGTYSAGSQLLYYYGDQIAVTSLFNPIDQNYYVKTSLINFYKAVHAVFSLGMEIKTIAGVETVVLNPLNTLFNQTLIHHFSSVSDFEFSVKNDQMINSVKVGYENDNGSESTDANSYLVFNYDGKVVKELDLTSPYRADLSKLLALDAEIKVDEIFFIQLIPDTVQPDRMTPDGGGILMKTPTGASYTFYNSLISPRRLLDNHYQYLASLIYHDATLQFTSGGNDNANNETSDSGQPLIFQKEYQDCEIEKEYADFTPYRFTIEVGLTSDFNRIISTASTGEISFDYEGNTYTGFIEKVGVKLAGRGKVTFTLIASPQNTFQNLIK